MLKLNDGLAESIVDIQKSVLAVKQELSDRIMLKDMDTFILLNAELNDISSKLDAMKKRYTEAEK